MKMVIEVNESGQLQVSGIPDNKVVAYGLLAVAHEAVADSFKQRQNLVQPVSGPVPSDIHI